MAMVAKMVDHIFLEIEGVQGESRDHTHGGSIDVLNWTWGAQTTETDGKSGACLFLEHFHLTKYVDASSVFLLRALEATSVFPRAKLIVRKAAGSTTFEYLVFEMENAIVTSFQIGGSAHGDPVQESLSIAFQTVKMKYQPQDDGGFEDGDPLTARLENS